MNNFDSILKKCSRFEAYSKKQASVGLPHYRTEEGPQKRRWRDARSLESLKRSLVALGENITDVDLKNWYNAQYLACLTNRSHMDNYLQKMERAQQLAPAKIKNSLEFNDLMRNSAVELLRYTNSLSESNLKDFLDQDSSNIGSQQAIEDKRRRMELHNAIVELEKEFPTTYPEDDPELKEELEQLMKRELVNKDPLSWEKKEKKERKVRFPLFSTKKEEKKEEDSYKPLPNWIPMPRFKPPSIR